MGILTLVEETDWVALIFLPKKLNKQVRLCANFSTGLNKALMTNAYPTPSPEDLHEALEGWVVDTLQLRPVRRLCEVSD
ncbi:hypothetical protein M514_04441 [Trichuris suis]|uniref:Uncharacterized protein n=1 Tax=Trichuris suis TaxID=68888 RepID=A0A085MZ30_9BILA|nr:hypothetical protein M513_04441 [Trichuris suis]KFD62476.1 hypothetical protein M514_04441 [Trichuris suis]KHJ39869.1 hypothetical protein D918_10093 [Trichuris suis]